jgi:hypothetical protein
MKTYRLDDNGKMVIANYRYAMAVTISDALTQILKIKLKVVLGEYWLNIESGLPFFEKEDESIAIFKKSADLNTIESVIKAYIANTEGVQRITAFSMDVDNGFRTANISWSLQTTEGTISTGVVTI